MKKWNKIHKCEEKYRNKSRKRALWRKLKTIFKNLEKNDFNIVHRCYRRQTIHFD
jgi:hypothetical protein